MGNLSEVDEAHFLCRLAYGLDEIGSVPIIMQENFFVQSVFSCCHAIPRMHCVLAVHSEEIYRA